MSKGVIKTKPVAKKDETSKPDPYANYTTGQLADMIADTTDQLQSAIRRWDNLNEETEAYQQDLDNAKMRYEEEVELHKEHLQDKARAEEQVQELTDALKVITDGFTAKIGKR
jgi:chromosome segregation ATPase